MQYYEFPIKQNGELLDKAATVKPFTAGVGPDRVVYNFYPGNDGTTGTTIFCGVILHSIEGKNSFLRCDPLT